MSVVTITGKEDLWEARNPKKTYPPDKFKPGFKLGIPKEADCFVTSLPAGQIVWKGKASKSISLDLDPGHYSCKIFKGAGGGTVSVNYAVHFYVDLSERESQVLDSMASNVPMLSGMQTSEGVRWSCKFIGCAETFTSKMSGFLHIKEVHEGEDILEMIRAEAKMSSEPKKAEQRQTA